MSNSWPMNKKYFSQEGKDTLYLQLQPYKIESQDSANAGVSGINKSIIGNPLLFLMPSSYTTTINHEWENVDSIGTRLVQKGASMMKSGKEIKNTGSSILSGSGLGGVVTQKYDAPITFKDSNRRTLNITVQLADQGDAENDVFYPVRLLEKWSCAEKGGRVDFQMPYIFEVKTLKSDLIYMKNAALVSVQPTYFGPYRNGYPSKCELTLDFRDVQPLYRSSF